MIPTFKDNSTGITDMRRLTGRTLRTDGYIILFCQEGEALAMVNLHAKRLRKNSLCLITPDIYFSIRKVSDDFLVRYIALSDTVFDSTYYKITDTLFWDYMHFNPVLRLEGAHRTLVSGWMRQMEWIFGNTDGAIQFNMTCNNVLNLLLAIDSELQKISPDVAPVRRDHGWTLVTRFGSLIVQHSSSWHEVKDYAEALNITPDYLYKVCRNSFGMNPKELIDAQILTDIKTYLTDTHLTVREIADRMNFSDSSYMCRFFRKNTGISPMDFRNGVSCASREARHV